MNKNNMINIAETGTEEDLINLLKSYGGRGWNHSDIDCSSTYYGHCLDTICSAANNDTDEARKAAKKSLVAAYAAQGDKAFVKKAEAKATKRTELETLRQFAFNGASEKVIALLKAQAGDEEAVRAIFAGAQQDRKRHLRRETDDDKDRRREKKHTLSDFLTKTGPFAPPPEKTWTPLSQP